MVECEREVGKKEGVFRVIKIEAEREKYRIYLWYFVFLSFGEIEIEIIWMEGVGVRVIL